MKTVCKLAGMNDDDFFQYFMSTLKDSITKWDYFVNWKKVLSNIAPIEKELNLLNFLIGKEDFLSEATSLIQQYPQVIKAIPKLLAIREKSIKVLVDTTKYLYKIFDFENMHPNRKQAEQYAQFLLKSGLGKLLINKNIKSLVDYVTGVEVGLDSNARKNRTGSLMESIVELFIVDACSQCEASYISQATASKIKKEWDINIRLDKSSRRIDFALLKSNKLYFIETNFYGGGGSKLKSTAGEYVTMNKYWKNQGIEFIWVTDGKGWLNSQQPLREYFEQADYLMNIKMLQEGYLLKI